jgi:hypothetical protein
MPDNASPGRDVCPGEGARASRPGRRLLLVPAPWANPSAKPPRARLSVVLGQCWAPRPLAEGGCDAGLGWSAVHRHALARAGHACDGATERSGQWSPPLSLGVVRIHSTVLRSGRVLLFSYPEGLPSTDSTTKAVEWDPNTGSSTDESLDYQQDLFCAGHNVLRQRRGIRGWWPRLHVQFLLGRQRRRGDRRVRPNHPSMGSPTLARPEPLVPPRTSVWAAARRWSSVDGKTRERPPTPSSSTARRLRKGPRCRQPQPRDWASTRGCTYFPMGRSFMLDLTTHPTSLAPRSIPGRRALPSSSATG